MIVFEIEQPDQSQPSHSIIKAQLRHVKGSLAWESGDPLTWSRRGAGGF